MHTAGRPTGYGWVRDLVEQADGRYVFAEHTIVPGSVTPLRCHREDDRSFLVIEGRIELASPTDADDSPDRRYGRLQGWHALRGSVYRLRNADDRPAVVLEAGSARGDTRDVAGIAAPPGTPASGFRPLDGYTVRKPWGFETWYTQNLPDCGYALKQIHMTAGHQSSLQSHRRKAETNYVVHGEATVLNGMVAPEDLDAVIDVARLPVSVHGPGSGWSSAPRILHRVIARSDYTSIEVSTPELDDVIRWQDDTGRGHGKIDSEHEAARR